MFLDALPVFVRQTRPPAAAGWDDNIPARFLHQMRAAPGSALLRAGARIRAATVGPVSYLTSHAVALICLRALQRAYGRLLVGSMSVPLCVGTTPSPHSGVESPRCEVGLREQI
jgi:hypothetical protein